MYARSGAAQSPANNELSTGSPHLRPRPALVGMPLLRKATNAWASFSSRRRGLGAVGQVAREPVADRLRVDRPAVGSAEQDGATVRASRNFGAYSAQPPADSRTVPDTTGHNDRSAPNRVLPSQGLLLLGGGSRIRTLEGISRRIYSPLPLAARATRLVAGCADRGPRYTG